MQTPLEPSGAPFAEADIEALAQGLDAAHRRGDGGPLLAAVRRQLGARRLPLEAAEGPDARAALEAQLQAPQARLEAHGLRRLVRAARHSAAPSTCLAHLLTLNRLCQEPVWRWPAPGRLALACAVGGSEAAARALVADAALAERLFVHEDIEAMRTPAQLRARLRQLRAAHLQTAVFEAQVRQLRSQTWVRIVARALAQLCTVETTWRELSDLADAVVDALVRHHLRRERSRRGVYAAPSTGADAAGFAVLAQGKLGGRELNLSSDIDIQFIYAKPADQDGAGIELQARLTAVAQRLVRALSHSDGGAQGYRVDVDLRPEGKKGALVHSIGAMEVYYARWGAAWERLALIRARHIAGQSWVSRTLLHCLQTFIYPRHVAPDTVSEVRAVAVRIAQERRALALGQGRAPGVDIKRDRGGIRDVELFVQTQQHLHGGKLTSLQTPNLFAAIQALELAGIFSSETAHSLRDAYRFLRALENCLQASQERQTHRLPTTPQGMAHLAGQMRLHLSAEGLGRAIAKHRRQIHRRTHALFGIPNAQRRGRLERVMRTLTQTGALQKQALVALGFGDGAWAQSLIEHLGRGRGGAFCSDAPGAAGTLAAAFVCDMAQSPDPAQALRLFADLDPLLRRAPGYLALLEQSAPLRHRLIDLLGTSEFFSRTLVRFPDLVDWLAQTPDLTAQRLPTDADAYAERLRSRQQMFVGDLQAQLGCVCRFKLREQLRLGLLDKAGVLTVAQLGAHLSALAQACVAACLQLSAQALAQAPKALYEAPPPFVIIALGRLGSSEMGYGSDVDLVFVWAEPSHTTKPTQALHTADAPAMMRPHQAAYALRLAQGCIARLTARNLEGTLYPIDTRLRPSGNQGPLVTHAQSFIAYYAEHAMLWERQALLRARPVAGDMALGQAVLAACDAWRYPALLPPGALDEIHRMRLRMGHERQRPRPQSPAASHKPAPIDIKLGQGGLTDLEFAVQALQLQHAHAHPSLKRSHTAEVLQTLGTLGLVSAQRSQRALQAYWYLRRLEAALRIVHDRALSALDWHHPGTKALARRMGYGHLCQPLKALQRDWQRHAKRAQNLYAFVFRSCIEAARKAPPSKRFDNEACQPRVPRAK